MSTLTESQLETMDCLVSPQLHEPCKLDSTLLDTKEFSGTFERRLQGPACGRQR